MPTDPAVNAARRLQAARKSTREIEGSDAAMRRAMAREARAMADLVAARPVSLRGACVKIDAALENLDADEARANVVLFARTAREALGARDPQGWGVQALECAMLLAAHHCGENGVPTVLLRTALEGLTMPHSIAVKLCPEVPLTPHIPASPRAAAPSPAEPDPPDRGPHRGGTTWSPPGNMPAEVDVSERRKRRQGGTTRAGRSSGASATSPSTPTDGCWWSIRRAPIRRSAGLQDHLAG